MLTRLLAASRPVAETASVYRVVAAAGIDSTATLSWSCPSSVARNRVNRDGGLEASTSYSQCVQDGQRSSRCSLPQQYSPATAPCQLGSQLVRTFATQPQPQPPRAPSGSSNPASGGGDATGTAAAGASAVAEALEAAEAQGNVEAESAALQGLDMESLMRVILHPMPLGRVRNTALFSGAAAPVVQLGNDLLFFDPAHTLSSTMRALYVIRQVLRNDGHVLVVNPNPGMRPLLREAAHLCVNSNVWFWYRDWEPGVLGDPSRPLSDLLNHRCQPNQALMHARGLRLQNPLCPPSHPNALRRSVMAGPNSGLPADDMKRLLTIVKQPARGATPAATSAAIRWKLRHRAALEGLVAAQTAEARLLPEGSPPTRNLAGRLPQLALVVSLDLSFGGDAVREAQSRNVPTVSLLNGHSDASHVSFPVYASEAHAGFQHWFLEWLLRVVNMPEATDKK